MQGIVGQMIGQAYLFHIVIYGLIVPIGIPAGDGIKGIARLYLNAGEIFTGDLCAPGLCP